ncbi:MAG: hypothetical protein K2X55_18605 [Burkholderiaceae bacterium]|nr:hypothetical protein [Burkholderiaceae bacterium]
MSITYEPGRAVFTDVVSVEEAEPLLQWRLDCPDGVLDLGACQHLHAAVLQVLMAAPVRVAAPPADPGLAAWLAAALTSS